MNKSNTHLEYMWLDGNYPQQIRSKTKITNKEINFKKCKENPSILPMWNFDGSSTGQAETSKSELLLKPVNIFKDPFKDNGYIVVAEVYNTDGTPHSTNTRSQMVKTIDKYDEETMYGLEQEYFIYDRKTDRPLGWPSEGFPRPQGDYYCAVGGNNVIGRDFVEEHASICELAGLEISGINAEVTLGQWEYQIGPVTALEGSDQLWISRYLLQRVAEKYNVKV